MIDTTKVPRDITVDDEVNGETVVYSHTDEEQRKTYVLLANGTWEDYDANGIGVKVKTPEWTDFTETVYHTVHDLFLPSFDLKRNFLHPLWDAATGTVEQLHSQDENPPTNEELKQETLNRIVSALRAFTTELTTPS